MAAAPWQRFDDAIAEHEEVQCEVVDVESFVIEDHAHSSAASHPMLRDLFRARARARARARGEEIRDAP
jgi:hypothetical protein